jgi:uncharacterized protein (TIGR03435 family)
VGGRYSADSLWPRRSGAKCGRFAIQSKIFAGAGIRSSRHPSEHDRSIGPLPHRELVQWAFTIADARILGGPAWFNSARFNIEAKADSSVDEQLRGLDSDVGRLRKQQMLQALLADRFGLKVHQETRKLPIYALTVAKSGPKFQPSQVNGTTVNARNGELTVRGSDNTIALLADALGKQLGRVVVDRTGLEGRYDLTLKWTPDELSDSQGGASGARSSTSDASAPSLFTAIQEQLGLKLVPEKGPVAVLVIDHVEMPSEN